MPQLSKNSMIHQVMIIERLQLWKFRLNPLSWWFHRLHSLCSEVNLKTNC